MAVQGIVVDRELRVEGAHFALRRHDQRVDLAEHRVALHEDPVELLDDRGDLLLLARIVDPRGKKESTGVEGLEADERLDVEAGESIGALLCDLLDVHAALGGQHEERLLLAPVERDREVVLLGDLGRPLDPELLDDVPSDVETKDLLGRLTGFERLLRKLDPAGLSPPTGEHLGLDDHLPAQLLSCGAGLLGGPREPPLAHRDPKTAEELLALVLVQIHGREPRCSLLDLAQAFATGRFWAEKETL